MEETKTMKKLVALLLALLMIVTLCACGKKDEPSVYYLNFKPEADAPGRNWLLSTPRKPVSKSRLLPLLPVPIPTP